MLGKSEIQEHASMKKKFPSYPRLPLFILKQDEKNYKEPNEGLKEACIRGFLGRVENWKKNQPEDN